MAEDDPNNPQRQEVIRHERRVIARHTWLHMRVQAVLREAAVIAQCPGEEIDDVRFSEWASEAFEDAARELQERVREEAEAREAVLNSDNNETNEEKPS